MISRKTSPRSLKIYCGVILILLVIVGAVVTTLSLTIFKPKRPQVELKSFYLLYFPNGTLTVKVDLVVVIKNPNYGSFKYKNTSVRVGYREVTAADVPIQPRLVPARGGVNFTVSVDLLVYKMMSIPKFYDDLSSGSFNFTSSATFHGKVRVLKVLKLHAKAYCTCHVIFYILSQKIESTCLAKIKL